MIQVPSSFSNGKLLKLTFPALFMVGVIAASACGAGWLLSTGIALCGAYALILAPLAATTLFRRVKEGRRSRSG
jgi:ABC-type transport system involved in cytochrome bd biosynthesis fused ATPase/permease subunit